MNKKILVPELRFPELVEGKDSEGENVGFDKLNQRVSKSQMPAVLPEPVEGNRNPKIDQ